MARQSQLVDQLNTALEEGDPRKLGDSLQALVEQARVWAAAANWSTLRPVADAVDDLLTARAANFDNDQAMATLIVLARQVCVVLALMGDSNGVRDGGYFRASLAHASRLDAMTETRLRLVDLVNLIQD